MKKLAIFLAVLFFITPSFLMAQDAKESRFSFEAYGDLRVIEDKKFNVVCYIIDGVNTTAMHCFPKTMLMSPAEQQREILRQLEQLAPSRKTLSEMPGFKRAK